MAVSKSFSSCTSDLKHIREFIVESCKPFPFSDEKVNEIVLAVDEACANVIRHGYKMSEAGCLEIVVNHNSDHALIVIKDVCSRITEKDLTPKQHDLCKPGGLGLCLIHYVAEKVRLIPHDGKGNWLELTVKFE